MPTTPSGTRTWRSCSPLGSREPADDVAHRVGQRDQLAQRGGDPGDRGRRPGAAGRAPTPACPSAAAASTSAALAASTSSVRSTSASAIAASAASLASVGRVRSTRAAARARSAAAPISGRSAASDTPGGYAAARTSGPSSRATLRSGGGQPSLVVASSRCRSPLRTAGHSVSRIEKTTVSRSEPSGSRRWLRRTPSCFAPSRGDRRPGLLVVPVRAELDGEAAEHLEGVA